MKTKTTNSFPVILLVIFLCNLTSCKWQESGPQANVLKPATEAAHRSEELPVNSSIPESRNVENIETIIPSAANLILERPQIPILCYHQIRDYRPGDSKSAKDYIVPPSAFKEQMKALADSGFHAVLPDDVYKYLAAGKSLPEKPVLISFDDGCDEQFEITHEVLNPLKFKACFFIMTVSVNRPNYMKAEQIRQLSDEGHSIGLHTWDHHNVKQYLGQDWQTQVEKPKAQLEKIIGKPVVFFAYPFGLWNPQAIPELKNRGLLAAFQLSTVRDQQDPLYTIRRIIITGETSGPKLIAKMKGSFH